MCVAVVALSLAILLLCFITFIVFYCPVASTFNNVYDDDVEEKYSEVSVNLETIAMPSISTQEKYSIEAMARPVGYPIVLYIIDCISNHRFFIIIFIRHYHGSQNER